MASCIATAGVLGEEASGMLELQLGFCVMETGAEHSTTKKGAEITRS